MISFVIPAYNEEAVLGATLRAIAASAEAAGQPHEIIVADDGSTDRTATIAEAFGARVVRVHHRQIAATRNSGARVARGEYLIFVDADTLVSVELVRAAVKALDQGAVGGGCAVRFDGVVPLYARVLLPILLVAFRLCRIAAGCFLFCRRTAFDAVGGFDEGLYASEELTMSKALAKQGKFVVLKEEALTSGRKLRQYRAMELLGVIFHAGLLGRRLACRSREGLDVWYEGRREASNIDASQ